MAGPVSQVSSAGGVLAFEERFWLLHEASTRTLPAMRRALAYVFMVVVEVG
jgi:hypothetical protein